MIDNYQDKLSDKSPINLQYILGNVMINGPYSRSNPNLDSSYQFMLENMAQEETPILKDKPKKAFTDDYLVKDYFNKDSLDKLDKEALKEKLRFIAN